MVSTVSRMFLYYATTRTNQASSTTRFSLSLSFSLFSPLSFEHVKHAFVRVQPYFHRAPIHTIIRGSKFLFVRALFGLVQFFVTDYRGRRSRRSRVSRSYKRYTTHIRTRRSLISTRSVRARAHFFFNLCFDTVVSRVPPPVSTARQMYILARRVPIVPLFNSFPFNS